MSTLAQWRLGLAVAVPDGIVAVATVPFVAASVREAVSVARVRLVERLGANARGGAVVVVDASGGVVDWLAMSGPGGRLDAALAATLYNRALEALTG